MQDDPSKKRLGRGLAALIGEIDKPAQASRPALADGRVPIELVSPNPRNPRRLFAEAELDELAQSIRTHGVVQPVVVRSATGRPGHYEIVAGERRWRASQRAELTELPVLVREMDDRTALEIAIVENVQRADLNPVEEARGYQALIDGHAYTQADLGNVIGKSRSHVANTLRLLRLPDNVLAMLSEGSLSAGHARALVTAQDPAALARRIVAEGLSVRQAESLGQDNGSRAALKPRTSRDKDPDTLALEKLLADVTGMTVTIEHSDNGGQLRINYKTLEQLDDLCRRLQG